VRFCTQFSNPKKYHLKFLICLKALS
jgi:hypothetical protein